VYPPIIKGLLMNLNLNFRRTLAAGVLLVIVGLPGIPAQQTPRDDPDSGGDTLSQIEATVIPPRDIPDLARRLLGVTDIPEPPTTAPPELQIGAVETFWADNLNEDLAFQVDAELVYKTEHIYMFVEKGYDLDMDGIKRSADTFENVIRPKVHEVFGTEWYPGIDADPHLYILHAANLGSYIAAYYGSDSEYPSEATSRSNEHEMFFVNLDAMSWAVGTDYYEAVLAHEFQHMVHWNVDSNEDSWLNEGLSELSSMIAGYGPSLFAYDYLATPSAQLNNWPEDDSRGLHYGEGFLFVAYFYDRYGEQATTALIKNSSNGLESVQKTLDEIGAADPFTGEPVDVVDLFGDWVVTNILLDPSVGDGRYAYSLSGMEIMMPANITEEISPVGESVSEVTPQWGPQYLEIVRGDEPQKLRLSFKGSDTVQIVPTDAHSGDTMWWSNRADNSDTRLTRAFDLSGVSSATLNYWTWYHIEQGWDYGYVMVSTDDGATWTPLETNHTTMDNPHSLAYGPGYSGQSGDWVEETVDLTPYAGQHIQVRFEYITDDATTQPGMLIDDVSIPEIDYSDDFETADESWISEGWLLTNNVLPQRFLVQLVQPSSETPVTRLLGPDDTPQGEWEITVGGDTGRTILVVSGLAPVTTQPAAYNYILTEAR
jgi:hypothetical protein